MTAVIVDARRTAIGRAGGMFRTMRAESLAAPVIRALLQGNGLASMDIDEVIFGNAVGGGGNIARLCALEADLPTTVPAITLDRQCTSGLDAILDGIRRVELRDARIVIAGGVESVSTAPLRFEQPSNGEGEPTSYRQARFSAGGYDDPDMMEAADRVAADAGIGRIMQDQFTARSHARALAAEAEGVFNAERVAVRAANERDECPKPGLDETRLARFKPVNDPRSENGGTVTIANTAPAADAASAVLIMTEEQARDLGFENMLRLVASASAGVDPAIAGLGAVPALGKLSQFHTDAFHTAEAVAFNEAFAGQTLACLKAAGLSEDRTNRYGGALAFGHPYGASGAILATRLFHDLARSSSENPYGIAGVSAAGGLGLGAIFQLISR